MLELFHLARAVCPQKVRLVLAEKDLSYDSHLLTSSDLRSLNYLKLNPHGYVPTLIHDGSVITESRTITEYLEDAFPDMPLMPRSALGRARVRNWSKQIDDSLHLNIYMLSFVTSIIQRLETMTEEQVQAVLPLTPLKRHITLELRDRRESSVFFKMAIDRFRTLLADMEAALCEADWLSGSAYGLADVDYTPYLLRLQELGFWQFVSGAHPRVQHWFDAVRSRPSFEAALTAWQSADDREREARDIERARPIFKRALAA